ncbi:MAG: c-type cytochrome biogenesis protein CcmI [Gammaproteobacteria bacterium]|nr:c-type cytochrome biogenesis protein CcmI [Gammaproteobacteria bacterium]
MMMFWMITAALVLAALAMLAPALLRSRFSDDLDRDRQNVVIARERLAEFEEERRLGNLTEAQFEQSKTELEQSLVLDLGDGDVKSSGGETVALNRWTVAALLVLVPALTLGLYNHLGSPELTRPLDERMASAGESHQDGSMPPVEQMMATLVERLKENPGDSEGWYLLGRSYMALKEYGKAAGAFEKLNQLVGDEPVVLLSWADAQAMAQSGDLSGKPAELIRKAVVLLPDDTTALWLAGMVEDQAENYELAIGYWEKLEPMIQDDPQSKERVANLLESARRKADLEVGISPQPDTTSQIDAASQGDSATASGIVVRVDLAPEFKGKVGPEESLFIYAKALSGPKMPLAAVRRTVKELPVELTLDDSSAMIPAMKLSGFDQVVVGARVSRSGEAVPGSGDLTGEVAPVTVLSGDVVEVLIDTLVP